MRIDTTLEAKSLVGIKGDGLKINTVMADWSGLDVLRRPELPAASPHRKPEEIERHRLYVLLSMSLVHHFWNGNKKGRDGKYNFRDDQLKENKYETYLGHNIAAIAVDRDGRVIDFDFNHNEVFRSSIEHAEARLMRRMLSLAGVQSTWQLRERPGRVPPDLSATNFSTLLGKLTVYSTAEPCAQCIGIMALGRAKEIIYVQGDDGTMRVANVLYNLMPYGVQVLPIAADQLGIKFGERLRDKFAEFAEALKTKPFWQITDENGVVVKKDDFPSLVSFLCTDEAYKIYEDAFDELKEYIDGVRSLEFPDYPDAVNRGEGDGDRLTNQEVLEEVRNFHEYAKSLNSRGTAH